MAVASGMTRQRGRRAGIGGLALAGLLALVLVLCGSAGQPAHPRELAAGSLPPGAPLTAPPLYLGSDAYRHWDKLAYLEIGDRVWGQSTADPAGTNADNSHVLRVLSDGARVLFDQVGPGVVTWMRMQENYGGPWQLVLDGTPVATVDADALGQLQPTPFPDRAWPYPLSLNLTQTQGSSIVAAPLPFAGSLRWAATQPNGNFYALYRKLPYGTPLTTWTGGEPIADVVQLLRQAGTDIAPTGIYSQSGTVDLPPGETTLAVLGGPSQIRALTFHVPITAQVAFGNMRLHLYWDGEATPSVDAPVKFLAGDGAGVYQPATRPLVQGWLAGAGGDGQTYLDFHLYWPMPFTATARIAVASALTTTLANIGWQVRWEPFPDPPGWWGTFHATETLVPSPVPGEDMTFLDVTGSGRVVGTVVNFTRPGLTLEGDPHFFIDDNQTPQIQVTGTEEWGTGGDYWHGGVQTSLPFGGLPSSVNNPPGTNVDGAALYRFLVPDSVPFNRHLVLRWEHGPLNDVTDHPYRATVLWYGTPVQTALLSDDLLIGDAASRTAHGYAAPGGLFYTLTAAYEYPVHSPLTTTTGIALTGVSTFTLALDPRNVGAFLRRQFDYGVPDQRARIFVDGQPAGTWYSAGTFAGADSDGHVRRFREEEFPLPPALTQNRTAITVRVEFVPTSDPPDQAWTEFRYQLYSFVLPPHSDPPTPTLTAPTGPPLTGTPPCTEAFVDVDPANPFYAVVGCLYCRGLLSGYGDGTFRPNAPTTRAQVVKLVVLAAGFPLLTPPIPHFTDVPPTQPFYTYIETAYAHWVVSGYGDGTFQPNAPITRGQLAKMVADAAGLTGPIPVGQQTFADVPSADPFWQPVELLAGQGVLSGYACDPARRNPCTGEVEICDAQGRPYLQPCAGSTRGQATKIIARTLVPACMPAVRGSP